MEEWKTIQECPNYEVSNMGRVRNKKTLKIRKPSNLRKSRNKYIMLHISIGNSMFKLITFSLPRLVGNYFIDKNYSIFYHANGNRDDNRVSNLRIGKRSYFQNAKKRKGYTSKYKYVYYNKLEKKWIVSKKIHRKAFIIGRYLTEKEAIEKAKNIHKILEKHNILN